MRRRREAAKSKRRRPAPVHVLEAATRKLERLWGRELVDAMLALALARACGNALLAAAIYDAVRPRRRDAVDREADQLLAFARGEGVL
jgi:hypothetical protein